MKVIVAGSRTISDYNIVSKVIRESGFEITEIVSGRANGVDKCGEYYAKAHNIKLTLFPANWTLGRSAGFIRNKQMAEYANALILIWNGTSKGSANMLRIAKDKELKIFERII